MIRVELNPNDIEETYVRSLNISFSQWGDISYYRWCFDRQIGELKTDIMILRKEGKIIAGSGVTYRKIRSSNGSMANVGIMTGSWTMPEARGQGCFSKIIEESRSLVSKKDGVFLLAFVTENNASFRRLVNAGSDLYPTYYLFSNDNTRFPGSSNDISPVLDVPDAVRIIMKRLEERQAGMIHFTYTRKEWESQFIDRPGDIEFLAINGDNFVVIEKKETTNKVLFLSLEDEGSFEDCVKAILARDAEDKRKLIIFTTSGSWKTKCLEMGFDLQPGQMTILKADDGDISNNDPWDIQSGDRM